MVLTYKRTEESYKSRIDNKYILPNSSMKLLGVNINVELKFNEHLYIFLIGNAFKYIKSTAKYISDLVKKKA